MLRVKEKWRKKLFVVFSSNGNVQRKKNQNYLMVNFNLLWWKCKSYLGKRSGVFLFPLLSTLTLLWVNFLIWTFIRENCDYNVIFLSFIASKITYISGRQNVVENVVKLWHFDYNFLVSWANFVDILISHLNNYRPTYSAQFIQAGCSYLGRVARSSKGYSWRWI